MSDVYLVGAGMTEFGTFEDKSVKELGGESVYQALESSGVDKADVEFASCGNFGSALFGAQGKTVGQLSLKEVGITGIPIVNVENGGATGAQSFRTAWSEIASGRSDVAIALGVEKMSGIETDEMLDVMANAGDRELEGGNGITWPGLFAMIARRRMHDAGTTREQMAQVAVNHHQNATENPYAQRPADITMDDVFDSPVVADPLRLYESCPTTDGAAAVILASESVVEEYTDDPVRVAATTQISGTYPDDLDIARAETVGEAATRAYDEASMTPDDVDVVEIHDAFSVEEPIYLEELGFCEFGEGDELVENGETQLDGQIPFCPSGGLLARGHPIGATGIAQLVELYWQLRGEADGRQVPDAEVGLSQIVGTFVNIDYGCVIVNILEQA
jgi:acetyl-CoA C-acetyltransferase